MNAFKNVQIPKKNMYQSNLMMNNEKKKKKIVIKFVKRDSFQKVWVITCCGYKSFATFPRLI